MSSSEVKDSDRASVRKGLVDRVVAHVVAHAKPTEDKPWTYCTIHEMPGSTPSLPVRDELGRWAREQCTQELSERLAAGTEFCVIVLRADHGVEVQVTVFKTIPRVYDNEKNQPGVALLLDELDEWLDGSCDRPFTGSAEVFPHFPYDPCSGVDEDGNELDCKVDTCKEEAEAWARAEAEGAVRHFLHMRGDIGIHVSTWWRHHTELDVTVTLPKHRCVALGTEQPPEKKLRTEATDQTSPDKEEGGGAITSPPTGVMDG